MSRPQSELSSSVPNLTSENITRRKRGHNDEFVEAFEQFTKTIVDKLDNWKQESGQEISHIKESLEKISETSSELKSEINRIREEYLGMNKTVKKLEIKHKDMQEEITSIKQSIQFHSDNHDDLINQVASISKEINSIKQLKADLEEFRQQNNKLKSNINASEQRDRLCNIEIVGVPESNGENLMDIILQLGRHAGFELSCNDVVHVNRVSSRIKEQGRPKNIIAKLRTRQLKDNLISQARKSRLTTSNLLIHGKAVPVYVNEHLTVFNKNLLKKTKEVAKVKEYQFVWTKNCRIHVRKAATILAIPILEEGDLKKII